jgi:hypothetical protein
VLAGKQKLRNVVVTMPVNGETVTADYDSSTGRFTFENIPDGTYTAKLTYPYGKAREIKIVVNGADINSSTVIGIINCNVNKDAGINATDIKVIREFKSLIGAASAANRAKYEANYYLDVNGDYNINSTDIKMIREFGSTVVAVYKYPALTIQNTAE